MLQARTFPGLLGSKSGGQGVQVIKQDGKQDSAQLTLYWGPNAPRYSM